MNTTEIRFLAHIANKLVIIDTLLNEAAVSEEKLTEKIEEMLEDCRNNRGVETGVGFVDYIDEYLEDNGFEKTVEELEFQKASWTQEIQILVK